MNDESSRLHLDNLSPETRLLLEIKENTRMIASELSRLQEDYAAFVVEVREGRKTTKEEIKKQFGDFEVRLRALENWRIATVAAGTSAAGLLAERLLGVLGGG